jgi:hypothetical protein
VFNGNIGVEIKPTAEDVAGFNTYIKAYQECLAIEQSATEHKK